MDRSQTTGPPAEGAVRHETLHERLPHVVQDQGITIAPSRRASPAGCPSRRSADHIRLMLRYSPEVFSAIVTALLPRLRQNQP